ncbi:hypothetical protein Vadar_000082 [Vaccinium darrowii]|uniref:Uncharacterized protein n=1 Tax=Vaccinium darrowii TaxID=229202 RepID=A0ACB7X754_9ERIC|nr:hypothetical protein Vadar_000082 [Vaccinium darrowii]
MVGDFNCILSNEEKDGGQDKETWELNDFCNSIDNNDLIDIGFVGFPFAWNNKRHGRANIRQRLDRAIVNPQWRMKFPNGTLLHLPPGGSDHCPVLVRDSSSWKEDMVRQAFNQEDAEIILGIPLPRNDMVFNSKKWEPDVACRLAVSNAVDFLEASAEKVQDSTGTPSSCFESAHRWEKPCHGWFKINFDGGLDHRKKVGGLGIVIRDYNGNFRAARAIHIRNCMEPLGIEAMAARESLIFALELGLQRIILEGDCQQVVKLIQKNEVCDSSIGALISDINCLRQSVSELDVRFVRRSGNSVAHCVAKNAVGGNGSRTWEFFPPPWLLSSLQGDTSHL